MGFPCNEPGSCAPSAEVSGTVDAAQVVDAVQAAARLVRLEVGPRSHEIRELRCPCGGIQGRREFDLEGGGSLNGLLITCLLISIVVLTVIVKCIQVEVVCLSNNWAGPPRTEEGAVYSIIHSLNAYCRTIMATHDTWLMSS